MNIILDWPEELEKKVYPYLGIDETHGHVMVVLFTEENQGTILYNSFNDRLVGKTEEICEETFEYFRGGITLKN